MLGVAISNRSHALLARDIGPVVLQGFGWAFVGLLSGLAGAIVVYALFQVPLLLRKCVRRRRREDIEAHNMKGQVDAELDLRSADTTSQIPNGPQEHLPRHANGFTPQHLHSQVATQQSTLDTVDLPRTQLNPSYEAYLASLPFCVRSGQSSSVLSSVSGQASTTVSPFNRRSSVSPLEPQSAYFVNERNVIGGENSDYFNCEAHWMKRKDPVGVRLPDSPILPSRKHSADSDTLYNIPL
jgi:hypothetical protein